jgi:hypothetical protein
MAVTWTTLANGDKRAFLTPSSTSPLSVPADWNNAANTIECIGPGGSSYGSSAGGGGAYAGSTNVVLTPSGTAAFAVVGEDPTVFNGNVENIVADCASEAAPGDPGNCLGDLIYGGGFASVVAGGGAAGPLGAGEDAVGATAGAGAESPWGATYAPGYGGAAGHDGANYGGGAGINGAGGAGLIVITYTPTGGVLHRTLSLGTGTFTVSGQALNLKASLKLALAAGSFAIAGKAIAMTIGQATGWIPVNARTTTWTNGSAASPTWTPVAPTGATWS